MLHQGCSWLHVIFKDYDQTNLEKKVERLD